MANYNKYINTFSGATDVQEWGAYIGSEYAGFPNVAYLETSDIVKYRASGNTFNTSVGSIYYSDGTTTGPNDAVDTTKTPIGIVVIPSLNDYSVQLEYDTIIMSLLNITSGGTPGIDVYVKWSTEQIDTALPNITSGDLENSQNFDGKYNTSVLAASGSTYPAAYACSLYSTEGTSAGDWYLPTSAEMMIAFSGGTSGNFSIIQNSIQKIKSAFGTSKAYNPPTSDDIYTSTEYSSSNARKFVIGSSYQTGNVSKTTSRAVRPFCRV